MTLTRRPRCPQCGARLRRNRWPGDLCAPCLAIGPHPRAKLPAGFCSWVSVIGWLGAYDFGPFFLEVRELTGWSQQTLGEIVDLDQPTISAVERGERRLCNIADVAAVARGPEIPPARLNFRDIRDTVGQQKDTEQEKVSWVDRRDFGQHAAALLFSAAAAGLDLDRLLALLPRAEPVGTRHVGVADGQFIEQVTAEFTRQNFAYGGGFIQQVAVDQVNTALPLLKAQTDLAGAHALAGDISTATSIGHQAVDAVTAVSSPRAYHRLRILRTVLEPLHTSPGVAELRERLSTVAA